MLPVRQAILFVRGVVGYCLQFISEATSVENLSKVAKATMWFYLSLCEIKTPQRIFLSKDG
jgi:hypothetical protein